MPCKCGVLLNFANAYKIIYPFTVVYKRRPKTQGKKVILDASSNKPIEFVNVVAPKFKKGLISNKEGEIIWNISGIEKEDTILVSHVSYEPRYLSFKNFKQIDTITLNAKFPTLSEVIVEQGIDISLYKKKNTRGYFQNKYDGGIYLRPGQQLGIRINTKYGFDKIKDGLLEMLSDLATKQQGKNGIRFTYNVSLIPHNF